MAAWNPAWAPVDENGVSRVSRRKVPSKMEIVEPNPDWPLRFQALRDRISKALGATALAIEHSGSTSVPGLPAKDVIDVDLTVPDIFDEEAYVPQLEAAGFQFLFREPAWEQHRFFVFYEPSTNLHVWGPNADAMAKHRVLRRWLREHPDDRDLYAKVKREVMAASTSAGEDMNAYTERKNAVIQEILGRADASCDSDMVCILLCITFPYSPGGHRSEGTFTFYTLMSPTTTSYTWNPAWAPLDANGSSLVAHRKIPLAMAIVPPKPSWPARFETLRKRITAALGDKALAIERIGSTSVPDLPAKDVIDIDIAVSDPSDEDSYVPQLEKAGFHFLSREPQWDHRSFAFYDPPANVHIFKGNAPGMLRRIEMREWLRQHPEDRALYAQAKRVAMAISSKEGEDMDKYIERKGPVIKEIITRAYASKGMSVPGWEPEPEPSA